MGSLLNYQFSVNVLSMAIGNNCKSKTEKNNN